MNVHQNSLVISERNLTHNPTIQKKKKKKEREREKERKKENKLAHLTER